YFPILGLYPIYLAQALISHHLSVLRELPLFLIHLNVPIQIMAAMQLFLLPLHQLLFLLATYLPIPAICFVMEISRIFLMTMHHITTRLTTLKQLMIMVLCQVAHLHIPLAFSEECQPPIWLFSAPHPPKY